MSDLSNERVTENEITTKEFLTKVEEAARTGAMQGAKGRRGGLGFFEALKTLVFICLIGAVALMVIRMQKFGGSLKELVEREPPVAEADLVLENDGILGYTAANFQEAILGDDEQLKKLEVYKIEVSDAAQLVNTGLANIKAFTKTQLITYHGVATYTVDLQGLSADDITLDEEAMTVHIRIPKVVLRESGTHLFSHFSKFFGKMRKKVRP